MTTVAAGAWLRAFAAGVRRNAVLLAVYLASGAILTVIAGQDVNWDLLNYHFYNPFQLLNGRVAWDVDVAGIQTYMNPAFDVPFFVAVRWLRMPSIVVGMILGAFHGLSLFFVHKIVLSLLGDTRRLVAHVAAFLAAAVSAAGAGYFSEVGATMGDTTMTVFVLAAIWCLVSRAERDGTPPLRAVAWAGLFAGLALGGKLVAAIYVAGLGLAIVIVGRSIKGRLVRGVTFGAMTLCGAAFAMGYWMWLMQVHYGSAAFPYLQQVIQRPVEPVASRYLPKDTPQKTFYPFYFAFSPKALMVSEVSFNDARIAVAYCAAGLFVVTAIGRGVTRRRVLLTREDGRLWLLTLCVAASFVVWEMEISVYRYAIPIEAISSVLVVGALAYLFRRGIRALLLTVPIAVYLFASTRPLDWGRIEWQRSYFGMDGIDLRQYEHATIFLWEMPNAYVVPYFPSSARFLRLASNWNRFAWAPVLKSRIEWAVQGADRQKIYLLETNPGGAMDQKENALEMLGLFLDQSDCRGFASALDPVRICAVRVLEK